MKNSAVAKAELGIPLHKTRGAADIHAIRRDIARCIGKTIVVSTYRKVGNARLPVGKPYRAKLLGAYPHMMLIERRGLRDSIPYVDVLSGLVRISEVEV